MRLRVFRIFTVGAWLVVASVSPAETNVWMLVPGFTVQELPLQLPNINNLRFAPDGRLTALGYNGQVWLLRDTNRDGLEDAAEPFWDKPTITVPVGMCWSTAGLFVSSSGKVSLLKDTDGDGKGDTEEIVASGWPEKEVASGNVDATGVTMDKAGDLYFGLLTANYANPYQVKDGVSHYDVNGKRGSVQKLNLKTGQTETIATGVRVPYNFAFNNRGDLFMTDQEGETWCPDGNPLDELNHIIPGRNYGFPPRHEKWLPDLVSEPPVVAFGPQHQSTCGFVFNEPHGPINPKPEIRNPKPASNSQFSILNSQLALPASPGQGLFGPNWWEGDAFVAGESRGKIWRVRLVKTPHGYVGKEFLIARLSMLTTDVAISPKGDLYVSCHSGLPDWGTGPNGVGKIFRISYTDPKAPQPVAAWAAQTNEVRVGFDRPLDHSVTNAIVGKKIEYGESVRAADRHEVLKPPYQVVNRQEATPRKSLKILSARLADRGQTLVLGTESHTEAFTGALTLSGIQAEGKRGTGESVDVEYDLSGAAGQFTRGHWSTRIPFGKDVVSKLNLRAHDIDLWEGWLPSADRAIADQLLLPFQLWNEAERKARLRKGDYFAAGFRINLPLRGLILHARSKSAARLYAVVGDTLGELSMPSVNPDADGRFHSILSQESLALASPSGSVVIVVQDGPPDVELSYSYTDDPTERSLSPRDLISIYFQGDLRRTTAIVDGGPPSDREERLTGGDYERGRDLFSGDRLKCATCHRIRGEGGGTGPDLSNLASRDAASVLRDINEPNVSINPDYVGYNLTLHNGDELTGFVRNKDTATLAVISVDGKETLLKPTDVKEMRPAGVSLMPADLLNGLSEPQVRDLLTFLLHEPPKRDKAEVERVLSKSENRKSEIGNRDLTIVLVASKQDHGPGQHDYPAWQKKWMTLLGKARGVTVTDAWEWPTQEQFSNADLIVFYYWNHDWSAERYQQLDGYQARGGGVAVFHSATIADKEPEKLAERIGLAAQPGPTKYLHTPVILHFVASTNHAISRGFRQLNLLDEPYWPMIGDTNRIEVLATADMEGETKPMIWTFQKGKGRVYASIMGHYTWTFDDPLFGILALRGLAWAAGEPAHRFDHLKDTPLPGGEKTQSSP